MSATKKAETDEVQHTHDPIDITHSIAIILIEIFIAEYTRMAHIV